LSKDPALIIAEARENPPQDVEEAKCLLALVRAERNMQRAKAQLADRLTEYNRLKAARAWKGLGDAEMTVGWVRSILSENGFSCSELTAALHRSKAVDGHQPIGAHRIHFIYSSHIFMCIVQFIPLLD
jgi:hypothetical protein